MHLSQRLCSKAYSSTSCRYLFKSHLPSRFSHRTPLSPALAFSSLRSAKTFASLSPESDQKQLEAILNELEMSDYLPKLANERLSLEDLRSLSKDEWRELIPEMGPRKRLSARIADSSSASSTTTGNENCNECPPASSQPAHSTELTMPPFFKSMKSAKVEQWSKSVGDKVEVDEVLCQVETNDAIIDFCSQVEGYLAAVVVPAGHEAGVGRTIGWLVQNESELQPLQDWLASSNKAAHTNVKDT